MKKKTIPAKKLHAYIRAAIQVVFFICFPSAFTTAFSAIKRIFTKKILMFLLEKKGIKSYETKK